MDLTTATTRRPPKCQPRSKIVRAIKDFHKINKQKFNTERFYRYMALEISERKLQNAIWSLEQKLRTKLLRAMYVQEKAQVSQWHYLQHKLMDWSDLFSPQRRLNRWLTFKLHITSPSRILVNESKGIHFNRDVMHVALYQRNYLCQRGTKEYGNP